MSPNTLRHINRLCQRIGDLHSELVELDVGDISTLAAVGRAARLLAAADEVLSRYYIRAAPEVPSLSTPKEKSRAKNLRYAV